LGYTIGRGLDAVLPFTCYSYWFSCYFDQWERNINKSPAITWVKVWITKSLGRHINRWIGPL
jgi:hypothetical protein